jgi:hypothetical protein
MEPVKIIGLAFLVLIGCAFLAALVVYAILLFGAKLNEQSGEQSPKDFNNHGEE